MAKPFASLSLSFSRNVLEEVIILRESLDLLVSPAVQGTSLPPHLPPLSPRRSGFRACCRALPHGFCSFPALLFKIAPTMDWDRGMSTYRSPPPRPSQRREAPGPPLDSLRTRLPSRHRPRTAPTLPISLPLLLLQLDRNTNNNATPTPHPLLPPRSASTLLPSLLPHHLLAPSTPSPGIQATGPCTHPRRTPSHNSRPTRRTSSTSSHRRRGRRNHDAPTSGTNPTTRSCRPRVARTITTTPRRLPLLPIIPREGEGVEATRGGRRRRRRCGLVGRRERPRIAVRRGDRRERGRGGGRSPSRRREEEEEVEEEG